MLRLLGLIFFFSLQQVLACTVETFPKILILDQKGDFSTIVKNTNCSTQLLESFINLIRNANGSITKNSLPPELSALNLLPEKVTFINLQDQLSSQSFLPINAQLIQAKRMDGKAVITLEKNQRLHYDCPTCSRTGESSLKVSIKDNLGSLSQTHWAKVEVAIAVKAFVVKRSLAASLQALDPSAFEIQTVLSSRPQDLASVDLPLQFHKVSRSLAPGEILKKSLISPVQLVRPGVLSQMTVQDSNIVISGEALPLSYGVWGEVIKLKNPRSARIIFGKVVDFNKVVLQL